MKHFALACIFVAAASAYAEPRSLNERDLATYRERLVQIFKSHVFTLDRPLVTFHYEGAPPPTSNYQPRAPRDLDAHVAELAARFFNYDAKDGSSVGLGEYVALDPVSTSSYGGDQPHLYVITLRRGARLLDLGSPFTETELDQIRALTTDLACPNEDYDKKDDPDDLFKILRNSVRINCRRVVIDAVTELGAEGIFYSYGANDLANCRGNKFAINIVRPSAVATGRTALFTDTSIIGIASPFLKDLTREAAKDFSYNYAGVNISSNHLPNALKRSSGDPAGYGRWKESFVYACGPLWANEPADASALAAFNQHVTPRDDEIRDLLIGLSKTFSGHAKLIVGGPSPSFSVLRINAVEKRQAKALGLNSVDDLIRAKAALDAEGPLSARYHNVEAALGEDSPGRTYNKSADQSVTTNPRLVGAFMNGANARALLIQHYANAGLGERLRYLLSMTIFEMDGGIQPLSRAALEDVELRDTALQQRNREEFKRILLKCLNVYDNAKSNHDLTTGPCGVRQNEVNQ